MNFLRKAFRDRISSSNFAHFPLPLVDSLLFCILFQQTTA